MNDLVYGFWMGCFASVIVLTIFILAAEDACQKKNNVYDCEFTTNPFTPAEPDK